MTDSPYRWPASAQADKGNTDLCEQVWLSWAQPFPRTWMLRPSLNIVGVFRRSRQLAAAILWVEGISSAIVAMTGPVGAIWNPMDLPWTGGLEAICAVPA